ncbi:MAG: DUF6483 family protein [Butyrivibrio sp.]|nr:DUF6483 family protein [Butyrivibrio sp.]
MYEQDYFMRMIHEMVRMLIKLLFGKDTQRWEQAEFKDAQAGADYERLVRLADNGDICGAENELVQSADVSNTYGLRRAVLFYGHLNEMSDEFLEAHNFSREEIAQGLRYMADIYGYGDIVGILEK